MKKKVLLVFFILFSIISFVLVNGVTSSSSTINWLSKSSADRRYCLLSGGCGTGIGNFTLNVSGNTGTGEIFNNEIFQIVGLNNITTSMSGNILSISHNGSPAEYDSDEIYINEISNTFTMNESALNNTIDDRIGISGQFSYINFNGSDTTGIDGTTGRTVTVTPVVLVLVDNYFLHPSTDYTISGTTLTFNNHIFDSMSITVFNGTITSLISAGYTGTDLDGDNGNFNRNLTTTGVTLVDVDNHFLHPTSDYSLTGDNITFLNRMFNSSRITVWD